MQVRYQAALRPDAARIIAGSAVVPQQAAYFLELLPNFDQIGRFCVGPAEPTPPFEIEGSRFAVPDDHPIPVCSRGGGRRGDVGLEPVPRAVDGETLLVEQVPDPANQQYFVVLVVASIAAALDRLQLREFLLPIPEHVRLHRTQITYLADREVPLGGDGW